jgi:transcriptional regulator with XRE-family HTH domain
MQTGIEELYRQTQVGSYRTSSVKSELLESFKSSKEYRHAFVEEKIRTQLAIQTKTIREQRKMSRPTLAQLMGKANSWVFRLEDPNQSPPTIPTLLKVAEAFDVDLEISFRPFSHLLNRLEHMTADSFGVPSFDDEIKTNTFGSKTDEEMSALWASLKGGAGIGGCSYATYSTPTGGAHVIQMDAWKGKASKHSTKTRVTRSSRARRPSMVRSKPQMSDEVIYGRDNTGIDVSAAS